MGEAYHREGGGGEEGRQAPPTTPTTAAYAAAAAAGLRKPIRIGTYPPASFEEAIELSRSKRVGELYKAAEALVADGGPHEEEGEGEGGEGQAASAAATANKRRRTLRLPEWALPFPNGQLSAFDRFGKYSHSLQRWFEYFGRECFVVISLEELQRDKEGALERIRQKCIEVHGVEVEDTLRRRTISSTAEPPVLNASSPLDPRLEPDAACLRALGEYYRPYNEELYSLLGRDLGWMEDERHWWYQPLQSTMQKERPVDDRGGREVCGREAP